ncbi:hypothetical protein BJ944DRAFT_263315 [Cunninghamella echinulata]|nr:hypothetical protein BJ944DRAFT_263315 [Cunninghamella echinulata]
MGDIFDSSINITYNAIVHGHNNHTTNWMLLKCDNSLRLIAYGVNGFSECRSELKEDIPLYGFIRIEDVYLFLDWQPPSIENEALDEHKNFHQALLDKFTSDDYTLFQLTASNVEELNEEVIVKMLSQRTTTKKHNKKRESEIDIEDDDGEYEQARGHEKTQLEKEKEEEKRIEIMRQLEEEQRRQEEELEKQRLEKLRLLEEERLKTKQQMVEANDNDDVLLNGYLAVKSHNNPYWKRRYFFIQNKAITISSEEKPENQIKSISFTELKRFGKSEIDKDCFISNSAVLETTNNEIWQFLADNQKDLNNILMAIQICASQ